jgi:hypothetical protein
MKRITVVKDFSWQCRVTDTDREPFQVLAKIKDFSFDTLKLVQKS